MKTQKEIENKIKEISTRINNIFKVELLCAPNDDMKSTLIKDASNLLHSAEALKWVMDEGNFIIDK